MCKRDRSIGKQQTPHCQPMSYIHTVTLPFYPSVQHVTNCGLMLMCDECAMWCLVYSKRKLNTKERQQLDSASSGLSFSCSSPLQDATMPKALADIVYVKKLWCNDRVETLYYSANHCVYWSTDLSSEERDYIPQCKECTEKPQVSRKLFVCVQSVLYSSLHVCVLHFIIYIYLYCVYNWVFNCCRFNIYSKWNVMITLRFVLPLTTSSMNNK